MPPNVTMVDPVGYDEFLVLMANARGVMTNSGTVVEEACILQVPSLHMRKATERPQVYDVGASVKFDLTLPDGYPREAVLQRLEALYGRTWPNPFGDGRASQRIAEDLLGRLDGATLYRHRPGDYHYDVSRPFSGG